METDKLIIVDELVEYINDYYHEYITEDFFFLKKEILFISDFLPFINLGVLPFSITEYVQKQLSNLDLEYDEFCIKATEINKSFFKNLSKHRGYIGDKTREKHLVNFLLCFFSNEVELEETILYYILDDLLFFKVPEEIIIGKLYQYFGDIIALKK